jgi:hypothetical protein
MSHAPPILTALAIGAVVGALAWVADRAIRGPETHPAVLALLAILAAGLWYLRLTREEADA